MSFTNDWNSFFGADVTPGTVVQLGGGAKVTKMHDGTAVYEDSSGAFVPYSQNSNPMDVARQATGLQKQWESNYQTPTVALDGTQTTRVDPAAAGFQYNQNGQVTRTGVDENAAAQTMGGDYTFGYSLNNVQDPAAREFYQKNPDQFYAVLAMGNNPDNYYKSQNELRYGSGWNAAGGAQQPGSYGGGGSRPSFNLGIGGSSGGASGGYGGSYGSGTTSTGGGNPYLTSAQLALANQVTDNMNRNILPGLSSSAVASGNFGGSRQGVIEANALNDANRQIANGMANLGFQAYESDANRNLQQQSIDNSYNLGMGNMLSGFYTAQRGQDLQSTALGAQLMNQGNANYLNAGAGIANLGTSAQQAPWQVLGNYTGAVSPFTGYGATTTSSQNSNPWAQALGGAMLGGQVGKLF